MTMHTLSVFFLRAWSISSPSNPIEPVLKLHCVELAMNHGAYAAVAPSALHSVFSRSHDPGMRPDSLSGCTGWNWTLILMQCPLFSTFHYWAYILQLLIHYSCWAVSSALQYEYMLVSLIDILVYFLPCMVYLRSWIYTNVWQCWND